MSLRCLVISDIHGSKKSINRINASIYNHDPDLSIICGDITNFGNISNALEILEKIDSPISGVTGNCDPPDVSDVFKKIGGINLNLEKYERKGFVFTGLSGSKYSEERLNNFKALAIESDIFVLHSPPYGYLDEAQRGKHIGERGLLKIINETDPLLVLSGHVHEDRGIVEEESTVYVNPGPAYNDNLAIVDIGEKIRAKLI